MKAGDIYWSNNDEDYLYSSKEEALECFGFFGVNEDGITRSWSGPKAGDRLYFGVLEENDVGLIDADDIITILAERAYDNHGEAAEDYPNVDKEAIDELQSLLDTWVEKHCKPNFFVVKDIKEYIITEQDIKDMEN